MKKFLLSIMIATALSACGEKAETPKENEKPVVKIGAIFPLSGDSAESGEYARDALIMAMEDVKKQNLKYDYKALIEDDQFKSNLTAAIANKFIFQDKINAMLTYYAPAGFIFKPLAKQNKLIHLSNTWEEKVGDGEYSFTQFAAMSEMIDVGVNYLVRNNIKKVAIISEMRATSEEFASNFIKAMKKENIEAKMETFTRGNVDFRLLIRKFINEGYEYFLINSIKPEFDIIVKQLHEVGVTNDQIMGTCGEMTPAKELYNGIVFPGTTIGTKDFNMRYKQRFNRYPNYASVITYDLVLLLIKAYEENAQEGSIPETEKVLKYIKNIQSYDCNAIKCTMMRNGHINNPANLRKCINAEYIEMEE
ncbi:MAG: ABC transporter substrate-binding protein [Alphaproteobacteria bacterium]|nr:ABC transporter substrate-binding protein [Alphaproteobacteria bacterium]